LTFLLSVDGMRDGVRSFVRSGHFLLICLICVIGGFSFIAYWFNEGHGASLSKLEQIRPGMTRKAVLEVLGNPTTINKRDDGSQSWFYSRATFCMVSVYLDRNGIVERTNHDH